MESRRVLATLCAWCTLNGIEIDSRLRFNWDPNAGCGIFSRSYIPANTTLVRIPKHAVLSTKSCTLASCIPTSLYGRGAQLALSLAVYIEILKGKFSRWSGYLQSVPRDIVDIPVFWNSGTGAGEMSCHRQKDGTEALHWLRGTEVAKILTVGDDNKPVIDEMRNYYHEVAQPLIFRHKSEITRQLDIAPTLHDFYRAHALVSSRAFVVDAYHGLCMVPVADAFNHESPHNVHLEVRPAVTMNPSYFQSGGAE
ncbi:hypothetical protein APHAL10511_004704 [Amanita phalloides]|nr:hypothetical protein APHAL10511_004704 [Amanita phalloides]